MEQNKKVDAQHDLQWGDHNDKLKDENFIDRKAKKVTRQQELSAAGDAPIKQQEQQVAEPGRDKKGIKEGESPLDLDEKRGEVF